MEDILARQRLLDLPDVDSFHPVIVGLGGVGFWTALYAVMSRYPVIVVDKDRVELTNLNRTLYMHNDAVRGVEKTTAFLNVLRHLGLSDGLVTPVQGDVQTYWSVIETYNPTCIIDVVDNTVTARFLSEQAERMGIPYYQARYDGLEFSVTSTFAHRMVTLEEVSGYEIVPSFVGTAAMLGAMVFMQALLGVKGTLSTDVKNLFTLTSLLKEEVDHGE